MNDGLSIDWFGRVFCNMPYDDVERGWTSSPSTTTAPR
jgi:hypothetical protein